MAMAGTEYYCLFGEESGTQLLLIDRTMNT